MAETVESHTLEYLRRLDGKLDRVIVDQRRLTEIVVGLARSIDHIRDDLVTMVRVEIGGSFANLEARIERRIDDLARDPLTPSSER